MVKQDEKPLDQEEPVHEHVAQWCKLSAGKRSRPCERRGEARDQEGYIDGDDGRHEASAELLGKLAQATDTHTQETQNPLIGVAFLIGASRVKDPASSGPIAARALEVVAATLIAEQPCPSRSQFSFVLDNGLYHT